MIRGTKKTFLLNRMPLAEFCSIVEGEEDLRSRTTLSRGLWVIVDRHHQVLGPYVCYH